MTRKILAPGNSSSFQVQLHVSERGSLECTFRGGVAPVAGDHPWRTVIAFSRYVYGSKPCTPGEHPKNEYNSLYWDVHLPNDLMVIGINPWPYLITNPPLCILWASWWWLEHDFYSSKKLGMIIPISNSCFSEGLKPPTSESQENHMFEDHYEYSICT